MTEPRPAQGEAVTAEDDLRALVRASLAAGRLSQAQASRDVGLSTKYMSQMLTGRAPLTLDWAEKILARCGKRVVVTTRPDTEGTPTMTDPTITDLRRELDKARNALIATQDHLAAHAQMNAALHCATEVFYSPLHAKVSAAIQGLEHALARTTHPRTPTLDSQSAAEEASAVSEHSYLSTGCFHGEHAYCQSMTGQQGEKRPGRCKFCEARCTCSCHAGEVSA